jgi:hypothetical protein
MRRFQIRTAFGLTATIGAVLGLAVVLTAGCGNPIPEPTGGETTPDPLATAPGSAAKTSPSSAVSPMPGPTTPPAAQQQGVAARLDRIEQLLATAAESTLFAAPESQVEVYHGGAPGPLPAASSYKAVPVTNGGKICGVISFDGKARDPKVIKVEKRRDVWGKEDRELYEVTVNDGKLQDVVLVLKGVKSGKHFQKLVLSGPPPGKRSDKGMGTDVFQGADIIVEGCTYGPLTGVIADGAELRFVNKDPVTYTPLIYYKGKGRNGGHYNQALPPHGKLNLPIKFKSRPFIKLECYQYAHMQTYFYRVDNPYYAFSGRDGTFTIDRVRPGTYKLLAWHPILGEQDQEVTVAANGTADVTFKFSSKKRRR